MTIIIEKLQFKSLGNDHYRVSGIVKPPDAPELAFLGICRDFLFENEDDLQLLENNSCFYYHRIDEVRDLIKQKVRLKRLEVLLGQDGDTKQA